MAQSEATLLGRGISFPPRIDADGRFAYSAGAENVRESIRVILSTDRRERIMLPDFGGALTRYLFEPNTPTTHRLIQEQITQALALWEPRIELEAVRVTSDADDPRAAIATVRYRLRATGLADRTDVRVQLAG
ncbi:MAG: GPW/gp25 family protein [Vicinamibacterales bacterium]